MRILHIPGQTLMSNIKSAVQKDVETQLEHIFKHSFNHILRCSYNVFILH